MGLFRRKDSPYWWFRFQKKGKGSITRSTNETDRKRAEAVAVGERSKLFNGAYFGKDERIEFKKHIEEYIAHCRHEAGFSTKRLNLLRFLKIFPVAYLDELSEKMIRDYITKRLDCVKKSTVNRDLSPLRNCLRRAVMSGQLSKNPFLNIRFFSEKKFARKRFLRKTEKSLLLSRLSGSIWDVAVFAMQTGLRQGEIRNLLRTDIDFELGKILVRAGDEDNNRYVPMALGPNVREILERQKPISKFVFCNPDGSQLSRDGQIWRDFRDICRELGIDDFVFHDLRHTFVTDIIQQERNWKKIAQWTGHSTTYLMDIYAHVVPGEEDMLPTLPAVNKPYVDHTLKTSSNRDLVKTID